VKPSGRYGLSFTFDLIPIGLEYIASYIEDAVEDIHIVDMEMDTRSFQGVMALYCPDLVCISMSATEHTEGLRLASIAKENGATVVVGGYHPTGIPELMLSFPQVDLVVRGEGEITMKELVEKGGPEGVLGVSYRKGEEVVHNGDRPVVVDLDCLPFPARHLRQYIYKTNGGTVDYDVVTMSRGCISPCTFCCEPSMSQRVLRSRSAENVMNEIIEVVKYRGGGPLSINFTDPNFMGNPKEVDRLCDLLLKHNLNVTFHALLRADFMARNPKIVKKMCDAGILWYEMGIESPNMKDLKSTKKGITTELHREAIRNIRENGGNAGGTFVIGLPDQTEEEIRLFPVYAKEIGLMSAAFGIATPFPGTEFYEDLDGQGLIFETKWDIFDEMHSVYKTNYLSKEKIEELATYCMAKFWNIDTFLDQARSFKKKTGEKKSLMDFIYERTLNLRFMNNNGLELQKDNFDNHIKTFLDAYLDTRIETYTREVGVHNILEMSRFLRILGPNMVQGTLRLDGVSISFIFKTTEGRVEFIRVIRGRQDDSTINFDIDLKWMSELDREKLRKRFPRFIATISHDLSIKKLWNTFRLFLAAGTEVIMWKLESSPQH